MMPAVTISGHRLTAIPAIHSRAVFAAAVNQACRDEGGRPDAIAVELGPGLTQAVASWFREMAGRPNAGAELPCMFGLVRRNHRIHPKHRPAVMRLQEIYGLPVEDLPPHVLWRHVGFAGLSLLCLSPTDSMIEAIRSAVELGIPVFGVDQEGCAEGERKHCLIEDPIHAGSSLSDYIARNAPRCSSSGDPWVDARREEVMASRLRSLIDRYDRVVFTGGIGHWQQLRRRLLDPALQLAAALPEGDASAYLRVLVEPSMAFTEMDVFPEICTRYEALRRQPVGARDPGAMYQGLLPDKLALAARVAEGRERDGLVALAQYLSNLCVLNQCHVPDLGVTLKAAESIISRQFAERFGHELLRNSFPWATREEWPDLPVLQSEPLDQNEATSGVSGRRGCLVAGGIRAPSFFVGRIHPGENEPLPASIEWQTPVENTEGEPTTRVAGHWVWPPSEYLLFGTACDAIGEVIARTEGRRIEPFSGSLEDGVDFKASLRAFARGNSRVHVRMGARTNAGRSEEELSEPVVYLFGAGVKTSCPTWGILEAGADLSPYVADRTRLREIVQRHGSVFVASVAYFESQLPEPRLRRWLREVRHLWGIVLFGNPCVNAIQAARWVEACDYRHFPILWSSGMGSLSDLYQKRHGMTLDREAWMKTLIRFAIPYARRRVVAIAPDGFQLSPEIRSEARARSIQVEIVPHSCFAADRLAAIQRQYLVASRSSDGLDFPDGIETALGQSRQTHIESLPARMRAQLEPIGRPHAQP